MLNLALLSTLFINVMQLNIETLIKSVKTHNNASLFLFIKFNNAK